MRDAICIRLASLLLLPVVLGVGCGSEPTSIPLDPPAFLPADGNDGKLVFPFDYDGGSVQCTGGEVLDVDLKGWLQVRFFGRPGNRNVELLVYHVAITYANAAGETYVFHDVGPDRLYLENGNLVASIAGRLGAAAVIGRLVIDVATGDVEFFAGKDFGNCDTLACHNLT